jgi:hypothetical protein
MWGVALDSIQRPPQTTKCHLLNPDVRLFDTREFSVSILLCLLGLKEVSSLSSQERSSTILSSLPGESEERHDIGTFVPPPDDAAFHNRDDSPDRALTAFTQHLLKTINTGKNKFTGLLESGRHNYELAMEFAFDLSDKLVIVRTTFLISFPTYD